MAASLLIVAALATLGDCRLVLDQGVGAFPGWRVYGVENYFAQVYM